MFHHSLFFYLPYTTPFSFFFFSSRRRHTRLVGDWSSDVCSSDLVPVEGTLLGFSVPDDLHLTVETPNHHRRLASQKGVPGPLLAAFHGFEEEGEFSIIDLPESRNRRFHVGEDLAINRDEVPLFRLLSELFERRPKHKTPCKINRFCTIPNRRDDVNDKNLTTFEWK